MTNLCRSHPNYVCNLTMNRHDTMFCRHLWSVFAIMFFWQWRPRKLLSKKKLLYVSVIHSLVLLSFQRYKRKSISKSRPNPLQQNFFSGRSEPTLTRYLLLFFAPSSWSGIFCINVFISSGFRDKKVTLYRRDSIDRHCWPKSCCIEQQRQS